MSTISILDPRTLNAAALLLFRAGGVLLIAPTLSARSIPPVWRTAFVVLLTLLLLPAALAAEADPRITPAGVTCELVIGLGIGFGAAVLVGAAETAGDIIAIQAGLSGSSTLDPLGTMAVPVVGQLLKLCAVLLLLIGGGHLAMLHSLAESLAVLPVGHVLDLTAGLTELLRQALVLFELGLRFAAPVVLVVFITNAALGVLARTSPQLNVFALAYPLQIGLGLLTLGLTLPFVFQLEGGWEGWVRNLAERTLAAFLTGARS